MATKKNWSPISFLYSFHPYHPLFPLSPLPLTHALPSVFLSPSLLSYNIDILQFFFPELVFTIIWSATLFNSLEVSFLTTIQPTHQLASLLYISQYQYILVPDSPWPKVLFIYKSQVDPLFQIMWPACKVQYFCNGRSQ